MTTTNNPDNYGIASQHNYKKELEELVLRKVDVQSDLAMQSEPSMEARDREKEYRRNKEKEAIRKLTPEQAEYLYRDKSLGLPPLNMFFTETTEVEIDGVSFWVRPVSTDILTFGHMVAD